MNKFLSPDAPERLAAIEKQVGPVLEHETFNALSDRQRAELVPLVAKRLKRARRVDADIILAELLLLRHQAPELFQTD